MIKCLIASGFDLWKCSARMTNMPPLDSKPTDNREISQYVHCPRFFSNVFKLWIWRRHVCYAALHFYRPVWNFPANVLFQILKWSCFSFFFYLFLSINKARILKRSSILYEPVHGKTNILGSDQVRNKQACTVTEDG